jgi:hypothetical protein
VGRVAGASRVGWGASVEHFLLSLPRRKRRGFLSPARLSQALPCSRTGYNILGPTWFWTGLHGGSALTQCRVALPETRHSQIVYGLQSLRLDRLRTAPTRAIWRQTPNRFYPAKELLAGTQNLLLRYQE